MGVNITGGNTFTTPVGPAAGDPRNASSVVTMGQGLADRDVYLKTRLEGIIGANGTPTTRAMPTTPEAAPADWAVSNMVWTNLIVGRVIAIPLDLPHGATLTGLSVWLGVTGHANLPANMPSIQVKKKTAGGTVTNIGASTVDPSALVATYNAVHAIAISGLSEVIDLSTYRYTVELTAESGTNSSAGTATGMTLLPTTATFSPP